MSAEESREAFLDRWSRLKQERAAGQAAEDAAPAKEGNASAPLKPSAPPALPPVESLRPDSDFKPFMDPRVSLETRRSALKKLFADAHFQSHDPFEPFSIDLTGEDPIPAEMLKTLDHARRVLFDEKREAEERAARAREPASEKPRPEAGDASGRQDA
ncbi:MAG: DUF3306 domain-containing protein [Burkholderiales bacterium]|nr:DUF3306 domain-containing protein [Burkholderiales bacterium]